MANLETNFVIPLDEEEALGSDSDEPPSIQSELDNFRQQWHQELKETSRQSSPTVDRIREHHSNGREEHPRVQEQAKYLFMQGVNAEENGQLYEAIQFYRRAVQLVPDIEFRIEEFKKRPTRDRQERLSESSVESIGVTEEEDEEEEDEEDIEDLIYRFHRLKIGQGAICRPAISTKSVHISELPIEVFVYIFKWVISNDIDTLSLEYISQVCRGFYVCARDEELWRLICFSIWGRNCGNPSSYGTWRNMYIQRPHIRTNGCYISKMSYYRQGERGLDNFYKPYHMVEYYRYVRFFPEGQILMLTTPEEPQLTLPKLRYRGGCKIQGLLTGYYKMAGDQVTAVLKRRAVDYNAGTNTYYRYKKQRQQQNQNDAEQSFHVEFTVRNVGKRTHSQLVWNHYAMHTLYKVSGEENIGEFHLTKKSYPPLTFSGVKSYTAYSQSPLQ